MQLFNSFALVTYLEGELAKFVDSLRGQLQPGAVARAHITILPPRPLHVSTTEALQYLTRATENIEAFDVCPGIAEAFTTTNVIKLSIAQGHEKLRALYQELNNGPFQSVDAYHYDPHITLALKIEPRRLQECLELAKRLWKNFGRVETVRVETLTLVQQDFSEKWHDLGKVSLRPITDGDTDTKCA